MVQRNKHQQKEPKIYVGKLNSPDNGEKYQKAVQENIRENGFWNTNDIDKTWEHFKQGVIKAAILTLEFEKKPRRNEWYDEECEEAISGRNQAYNKYISRPIRAKRTEYKNMRRIADKICRKKKRAALNEHLIKICEEFKEKKLNMAFKDVKSQRDGFKPDTDLCKDSLSRN
jgi:hypothetical protein